MSQQTVSRYDPHADWYVEHTGAWDSAAADVLPSDLAGQRILDQACGWGQLSRILAERGARVSGVDLSENLVGHARELEAAAPLGIEYLVGDATTTSWWDGEPYDQVVCNMALMDIDDLPGALSAAAAVVAPGGLFTLTVFHPCFPGRADDPDTLPSWPPDRGYAAEGWWTTGRSGVRGHVGANHRMLSTYLNAVLAAGFELVAVGEEAGELPRIFWARGRRRG
ncbi:Methyltransferase type 11 [Beutenbergia cavernae DSM 12333]|uniref:Methyltransferase type 11 n=1 Tax=Beutenbergia cavernae (strain ATCC BAA-8 / DSM 12333 / CCUG 43141 / JCM 11478 / NBRC 16432 / NCIMB 13614 / HKI 0122) TaxID=471853 RepID=C5C3J8_BEUC1|nr:class I SAM-dependent methyltransferase [Beutenbergia cavernae]ACQ81907.1 Methyltransferase type 11 [Beutenbergia cavernae DSM 12333]